MGKITVFYNKTTRKMTKQYLLGSILFVIIHFPATADITDCSSSLYYFISHNYINNDVYEACNNSISIGSNNSYIGCGPTDCQIRFNYNTNGTLTSTRTISSGCGDNQHPEFNGSCVLIKVDNEKPCWEFGSQPTFNFLGQPLENTGYATWDDDNARWNISRCRTFITETPVQDPEYHCDNAFSSITFDASLNGHIKFADNQFSITYTISGITPPHYCEYDGCEQYYTAEPVPNGPNGAYTCVQDNTNNCTSGFDFDWATQSCNVNNTEYTDKTGTFTLNSGAYGNGTTDYLNDSTCLTGN